MKRGLLPSSYIKLVSFGITVFDALFTCYWRESAKSSPLQFYCQSLPLSCIVKERELLFYRTPNESISQKDNNKFLCDMIAEL